MMALQERHHSGSGQSLDVSLYDCGVSVLHPHLANYFANGKVPARSGNAHPNIAPYDTYATGADPIFLAVGNNGQGISGVAWNARMMYVAYVGGPFLVSTSVDAYEYIRKNKQLWLDTNGSKGANVVVPVFLFFDQKTDMAKSIRISAPS